MFNAKELMGRYRPLGVAFSLFLCPLTVEQAAAQTLRADEEREVYPVTVDEVQGIVIDKSSYTRYVTTGNPMDDDSKRFIIYNPQAKKFLTPGAFWGTHAALSEKPFGFWLQNRTDYTTVSGHFTYVRYPEQGQTTEKKESDFSRFLTLAKDNKQLRVGSVEGKGRSNATYQSVKIVNGDNTERNLLSAANYQPNYAQFTLASDVALDFDNGDKLIAGIDISLCKQQASQNPQCLLSIGSSIDKWSGEGITNIHTYYDVPQGKILVDFTYGKNNSYKKYSYSLSDLGVSANSGVLVLEYSKKGFSINGRAVISSYKYSIPYTEGMDGRAVRFKSNGNGDFVTDDDNYLQIAGEGDTGELLSTFHECQIYADVESSESNNATLFITSKVEKDAKNTGKYLSFVPSQDLKLEGTTGVYTDRKIDSYDNGVTRRALGQWTFEPTGETGVYRLSLTIANNLDGTDSEQEHTYYLTATSSYTHGYSDSPAHYCYHQWSEDEKTQTVLATFEEQRMEADLTDEADAYAEWKIIPIANYNEMLKNDQEKLPEAVNLSYLIGDASFDQDNTNLSSWQMTDGLKSSDNAYHEAKLRIGMEGYYKTAPTDGSYCTYDAATTSDEQDVNPYFHRYDKKQDKFSYGPLPERNEDGSVKKDANGAIVYKKDADGNVVKGYQHNRNLYRSTHGAYLCASIQNGGYGNFYQRITVSKTGSYVLTCQGMSTVGAKLYIADPNGSSSPVSDADGTVLPIVSLTDKTLFPTYDGVDDNSTTPWPLDPNKPMYNAARWMSDPHIQAGQANIRKYACETSLYVEVPEGETKELEVGIYVPQTDLTGQGNGNIKSTDFTAFRDFHLLYSGKNIPNIYETPLLLNENYTNLNYIDKGIRPENNGGIDSYHEAEMRLYRTFNPKQWNTLVLPVALTKTQFTEAFGENARLVKLSKIDGTKLVFANVAEENGFYLQAYHPYLIYTEKAHGDEANAFNAAVVLNEVDENNEHRKEYKSIERDHFLLKGITLDYHDADKQLFDFAGDQRFKVNGDYTVADETVVTSDDGSNTRVHFYGTLCKTYDDPKTPIDGRPKLDDGQSYYMKPGTDSNFYNRPAGSQYGLKGFRCWLAFEDGTTAASPSYAVSIEGVSEDGTLIEGVTYDSSSACRAQGIYRINGQKVSSTTKLDDLPPGMYIVNGKKYIVNK